METLLIILLALASIAVTMGIAIYGLAGHCGHQHINLAPKTLHNLEDFEEARRYAAIFGLTNDAHDLNIQELLEMGRKYEAFLGSEAIDNIVEQHEAFYAPCNTVNIKERINARRHYVNRVVKESNIVAHINGLAHTIFIQIITGGNKDGEPSINANMGI
jgi:hypothetical protein